MFNSLVAVFQAIVDHFEDQTCPVTERLKVFYCSRVSPRWVIQVATTYFLKWILSACLSDLHLPHRLANYASTLLSNPSPLSWFCSQ